MPNKKIKAVFSPQAFLLCAGRGERFRPLTRTRPKVLIPFLRVPIVFYNLHLLKQLGVRRITANTHGGLSRVLKKNLVSLAGPAGFAAQDIKISFEKTLLGSAGGLWKAFGRAKTNPPPPEDFYYLNGDSLFFNITLKMLKAFLKKHQKTGAWVSFLCAPAFRGQKGVLHADHTGRIVSFNENKNKKNLKKYHFTGLALMSSQIFKHWPGFLKKANKKTHLFYDVLETFNRQQPQALIRVHCENNLKTADMNCFDSYLKGHAEALKDLYQNKAGFLKKARRVFYKKFSSA